MRTRTAVVWCLALVALTGCDGGGSFDDPLAGSSASTVVATGGTGPCPLAPPGGGTTEVTTKAGDFDGDGVADTLRAYKLTGQWHLRVELAAGGSGADLVVPGVDPTTGLKAVGGFNIDRNVADEALAVVGGDASTTELAMFTFATCKLARVTVRGSDLVLRVGATPQRRSGLRCVQATALQVLSAATQPNTTSPFTGSAITLGLVGSELVQGETSPPETFGIDDPKLASFSRFDCGSLSLS